MMVPWPWSADLAKRRGAGLTACLAHAAWPWATPAARGQRSRRTSPPSAHPAGSQTSSHTPYRTEIQPIFCRLGHWLRIVRRDYVCGPRSPAKIDQAPVRTKRICSPSRTNWPVAKTWMVRLTVSQSRGRSRLSSQLQGPFPGFVVQLHQQIRSTTGPKKQNAEKSASTVPATTSST